MKHGVGLFLIAIGPIFGSQVIAQDMRVSDETRLPPAFIANMEGAVFEGILAGLPTWTAPDQNFTFFEAPDGETIIAGFALDENGNDAFAPPPEEDLLPPEPEPETSSVLQGALDEFPDDLFSPEEEAELLAGLISAIDSASNQAEYETALMNWGALLEDRVAVKTEILALSRNETESTPQADVMSPGRSDVEPTDPLFSDIDQPIHMSSDTVEDSIDPDIELFSQISEGFWFTVGSNASAPVLYALIDPECPYCAEAMLNLRDRVEGGDIQLRILLAPVVSNRSPQRIAGILNPASGNVADAYWSHEIEKALQGRSSVALGDPSDLSDAMINGISYNIDILRENDSIRGVPFFTWMTAEGPSFYEGAPRSASDLIGLLP